MVRSAARRVPRFAYLPRVQAGPKTKHNLEELKLEQTKLDILLKACDRVFEASERVENIPNRLAASIVKLCEVQQEGEKFKGDWHSP